MFLGQLAFMWSNYWSVSAVCNWEAGILALKLLYGFNVFLIVHIREKVLQVWNDEGEDIFIFRRTCHRGHSHKVFFFFFSTLKKFEMQDIGMKNIRSSSFFFFFLTKVLLN